MHTKMSKKSENNTHTIANTVYQKQNNELSTFQFVDNRTEAITQKKVQDTVINNASVNKPNFSSQKISPIQKVANIAAGKQGICGPSVLSGIMSVLGGGAKSVDEIKAITLANTGSAVGEIFSWADMKKIADALGINAVKHSFNSTETLLQALESTGDNPVLAAISNVGFPGKEREAYDQRLIAAGKQWVRAHWIAITNFDVDLQTITYKDNGNNVGTTALFSQVVANNAMTNATWDWDDWGAASGMAVPETKQGTSEAMDLSGYIVEFRSMALVPVK